MSSDDRERITNVLENMWQGQSEASLPDEDTDDAQGVTAQGELDPNGVYVDSEGKLFPGNNTSGSVGRLTKVDRKGLESETPTTAREKRDWAFAREHMPSQTVFKQWRGSDGKTRKGFLYRLKCEQGREWILFAYYDGSFYQVNVIEPSLARQIPKSVHAGHLFEDGHICLGSGSDWGRPTLAGAWGKSVYWVECFSLWINDTSKPFPGNKFQ